ncbi:hypothetical protein RQP46_007565 [Phenoliferia psychrophenolica]
MSDLLNGTGGAAVRLALGVDSDFEPVSGLRAVAGCNRELRDLAAKHRFNQLPLSDASTKLFNRRVLPFHAADFRQIYVDFYDFQSTSSIQKALAVLPLLPNVYKATITSTAALVAFGDVSLFAPLDGDSTEGADSSDEDDHDEYTVGLGGNEGLFAFAEVGAALAELSSLKHLALDDPTRSPLSPAWLGSWKSPLRSLRITGRLCPSVIALVERFAPTLEKLELSYPGPDDSPAFSHSNFPLLKSLHLYGHPLSRIPPLLSSLSSASARAPLERIRITPEWSPNTATVMSERPSAELVNSLKLFEDTLREVSISGAYGREVLGLRTEPLVLAHTTVTTGPALSPFFERPTPEQGRAEPDGGRSIAEGYHTALVEALDFGRGVVDRALAEGDLEELGKMLETLQRIKGLQMLQ